MAGERWLFKEEPSHYSFEQLLKDRRTVWDGVENNLALKHLRNVKKGDEIVFYQTGDEKRAVGVMKAASDAYVSRGDPSGRLAVVDVEPVRRLTRPVSLAEIKADPRFAGFDLLRISRLSVMPVPEKFWTEIMKLSERPVS